MALELEDVGQGVADDRRPQVADVHLLGHVGPGVVDHGADRVGHRLQPGPVVAEEAGHPLPQPLGAEAEVDEPAGHRGGLAQVIHLEGLGQAGGEDGRRLAQDTRASAIAALVA